jgi:hypothetical protein
LITFCEKGGKINRKSKTVGAIAPRYPLVCFANQVGAKTSKQKGSRKTDGSRSVSREKGSPAQPFEIPRKETKTNNSQFKHF